MKLDRRRWWTIGVAGVVLAAGLTIAADKLSGGSESTLSDSVLAALARSTRIGPVPAQTRLTVTVDLRIPGEAAALAALRSSRASQRATPKPNLGVAPGEIGTVTGYLRSHGLSVDAPPGKATIPVATGSASKLEAAFGSKLSNWKYGARTFFANDTDFVLPSNIASYVDGVIGLDDYGRAQPLQGLSGGAPFDPTHPDQIQNAYGASKLIHSSCGPTSCDGSGQTVAIFAENGFTPSAIAAFDSRYDQNHASTVDVTTFDTQGQVLSTRHCAISSSPCGKVPSTSTLLDIKTEQEAELDIEAVQTMAPKANLDVYVFPAPSACLYCQSLPLNLSVFLQHISYTTDQVVSISYGECEASETANTLNATDASFGLLALEGKTVFAGSGDSGRLCGFGEAGVTWPASDSYVTAVGGTSLTLTKGDTYGQDIPWDVRTGSASGGGYSRKFNTNIPEVAATATMRIYGVDLHSPFSIPPFLQRTFSWGTIRGTSVSTPLWAGAAALIDQYGMAHAPGHFLAGDSLGLAYRWFELIDSHQALPGLHAITTMAYSSDLYRPDPIAHSVGFVRPLQPGPRSGAESGGYSIRYIRLQASQVPLLIHALSGGHEGGLRHPRVGRCTRVAGSSVGWPGEHVLLAMHRQSSQRL